MTEPVDKSPCTSCGEPVLIEYRDDLSRGGTTETTYDRVCTNRDCELNQPGPKRVGDAP